MGLFSSSTKVSDPLKKQKREAADILLNLMRQQQPNIPTQGTAGVTGQQQSLLASLGGMQGDMNANYGQARDYYQDILGGGYDPRNSDFYKGLRQEADVLRNQGNTAIKQQASAGGMLHSTPVTGNIAQNNRAIDNQLLTQLGALYENERGRMGQAAQGLTGLDQQRTQMTGQMAAVADLERQIEQQRQSALYQQAYETVMFPYQQQRQLASAIFGGSEPVVTGGGMTDFGAIAQIGGNIIGGMALGGTGFFA